MKNSFFLLPLILFSSLTFGQKTTKIACVGDSITYGLGIEDRDNKSYPAVLQQLLGSQFVVGNFGKSGATLLKNGHRPYVEQVEYQQALAFKGDIVVIHLGVNDTDPRNWPNHRDHFVQDYLDLIASFRKANPKVRILIAEISPVAHRHHRFESGTRDWHYEIRQAIKTVAAIAQVQLIDFYEPLISYPQWLPDAIHPNEKGLETLAKTVFSAITGNYGGLQLSPLYSDNMVLQHGTPLTIKGKANAHEKVSLRIGKQHKHSVTDLNGFWQIEILPLKAGEAYTLEIETKKQKKIFKNVVAGEVWLCSGQSNMEFALKDSDSGTQDLALSNNPNLRFFDMKARWRTDNVEWSASALDSLNLLHHFKPTQWQISSPETAKDFSAVAFYFGKSLNDSINIPIGLICNAVGGSPTESWIDRNTLENHFPRILHNWRENDFIQDWVRGRAKVNLKNATDKLQRHPYEPAYLFESGIKPLENFAIKGVIWYQGESNAHNKDAHNLLFKLLVQSWRTHWNNAQMPFYYVQLSSLNRPSWGWFRDSQRQLLYEIENVGMAVSSDCGDFSDVHPRKKRPVGERLARLALHSTYGKNRTPSGPLFKEMAFREQSVFVSFDYANELQTSDGKEVRSFEIAEHKGLFVPAQAEIIGNQVRVYNKDIKNPKYVRYGWQPFTDGNLVNEIGLPTSTFTTEK